MSEAGRAAAETAIVIVETTIATVDTASKAVDTINETGEPCKGNIIQTPNTNPNSCNIDVTLSYSVCNLHLHTFGAEYNFLFDGASSSAKVTTSQGIEDIEFPFTKLSTTEFFRNTLNASPSIPQRHCYLVRILIFNSD